MSKLRSFKQAVSRGYWRAGAVVGSAVLALPAMAQETDPFFTAANNTSAKVELYAAALVGITAVSVIFFVAMKYVKKIPRAA